MSYTSAFEAYLRAVPLIVVSGEASLALSGLLLDTVLGIVSLFVAFIANLILIWNRLREIQKYRFFLSHRSSSRSSLPCSLVYFALESFLLVSLVIYFGGAMKALSFNITFLTLYYCFEPSTWKMQALQASSSLSSIFPSSITTPTYGFLNTTGLDYKSIEAFIFSRRAQLNLLNSCFLGVSQSLETGCRYSNYFSSSTNQPQSLLIVSQLSSKSLSRSIGSTELPLFAFSVLSCFLAIFSTNWIRLDFWTILGLIIPVQLFKLIIINILSQVQILSHSLLLLRSIEPSTQQTYSQLSIGVVSQCFNDSSELRQLVFDQICKLKLTAVLIMSQESACPHCHLVYSDDNPPKSLINCSHTICLQCLKQLILCPVDRTRIQLRRFTLEAFKTNHSLLELATKKNSPTKSLKSHHNSKKSTPRLNESTKQQKSKSSRKALEQVKIQQDASITEFEEKKEEEVSNHQITITIQPQVKEMLEKQKQPQVISPKQQTINYQMCLLHSKKADLICLEDKVAICAGCGLFGEHKLHTLIPYDTFLSQYSTLAQDCFKNYEELQNRFQKMNTDLIQEQIIELLAQKRTKEIKNIKGFIRQLTELVKLAEKELINNLDITINFKKQKLMKSMSFQELIIKRDQYMSQVQGMTEGLECLFNLEQIEKYIPFIDPNSEKSYIQQEGEYLIREIDNYSKMVQKRIQEESTQFSCSFKNIDIDALKPFFAIDSYDSRAVNQLIEEQNRNLRERSANQNSSKPYTPSRSKNCKDTTVIISSINKNKGSPTKQHNEDNLLLELNSKSNSPDKKDKNISPIHPMSTFQNFQITSQCSMGPQFFLKVAQPPLPENRSSKSKTSINKTLHPPRASKSKLLENSENFMGDSTARLRSKPKSNNNSSNHMTERELLNVLNQKSDNKKRKKIELPQKYAKIYQDLQKDRLQVADFGGAFLGDNTILGISDCFMGSRGKLKQIKLMNNKLSDDIFPELISRCRSVHSLNLSYNQFTQKCLQWLLMEAYNLGDLKNITLSNNKIVLRSNKDKIQELKRRGINVSL